MALVFESDTCQNGMILGTNFLIKRGIKLDNDTGQMIWYDCILPMCPRHGLPAQDFDDMQDIYLIDFKVDQLGHNWLESYATEILDTKYQWTDDQDVVANQHHLTSKKKCNLLDV